MELFLMQFFIAASVVNYLNNSFLIIH